MAFVKKKGKCQQVRKGTSGELLTSFCGKDALKMANKEVARLHKKNKPKASSRGKNAEKRINKRK